jgi:hypothetical protein
MWPAVVDSAALLTFATNCLPVSESALSCQHAHMHICHTHPQIRYQQPMRFLQNLEAVFGITAGFSSAFAADQSPHLDWNKG